MYVDVCDQIRAKPSQRDLLYVERRFKHEGVSFLTITLPSFNDALLRGLEDGYIERANLSAFAASGSRSLPRFLQGLTSKVFDLSSGELLPEPCHDAIYGIRQLTCLFKKVKLECSKERIEAAKVKFMKTDTEVVPLRKVKRDDARNLRTIISFLFGGCFSRVNHSILGGELSVQNGPGAVAEGFTANGKYDCLYYERLEPLFPYSHYRAPSLGRGWCADNRCNIDVGREQPARLALVPKTLKTPRLIAVEPAIIQWAQQGLMKEIYRNLDFCPGGRVLNIDNQRVNGERARIGSISGSLCTLDLSEASDRVSAGLVAYVTRPWKQMHEALFRARSSRLSVDGAEIRLRKFASMGSAVCFPIEAIIFAGISVLAMMTVDNISITRAHVLKYARKVTVFGDDIVAENRYALYIKLGLEYFGLKVNDSKSFHKGLFRESCGVDAYEGTLVNPIYLRSTFPSSLSSVEETVSSVEFANNLYSNGLWATSNWVFALLERQLGTRFPVVGVNSPILGRKSYFTGSPEGGWWNKDLHRYEVSGYSVRGTVQESPISDSGKMIKALSSLETRPPQGDGSYRRMALIEALSRCTLIEEEPRPHAAFLKRGKGPRM
jgi:hypothetical protein